MKFVIHRFSKICFQLHKFSCFKKSKVLDKEQLKLMRELLICVDNLKKKIEKYFFNEGLNKEKRKLHSKSQKQNLEKLGGKVIANFLLATSSSFIKLKLQ